MRAVLAWLRLDLRRRGRSLVVLALLLALSGGLVLSVLAGARRNGSTLDRLRAQTLPATAIVLPNTPGFDWDAVQALPEVEALGRFSLNAPYGVDGVSTEDGLSFPSANADFYTRIERPAILEGRTFDNSRPDEVLVSKKFLSTYHVKVGDTLTARLFTPAQIDASLDAPNAPDPATAKGPTAPLRIVGVCRMPWSFEFGEGGEGAGLLPTFGFYEKYRSNLIGSDPSKEVVNALVRLRGGAHDLPQFRADMQRLSGGEQLDISDLSEGGKRIRSTTEFERNALLLFALVAAVAAMLIVGQAIVRYTGSAVVDLDVLRALGLTRQESVLAAVAGPVIAAAMAAVGTVTLAYAASSQFPIGVGKTVEPDPGRHADWAILLPGAAAVVVLVSGLAYVAAFAALGHRGVRAPRRSAVATLSQRVGLPVPMALGTRLALEPGRGRTAVPVRPAMVGAIAGVLGIVAAATFASGLNDAVSTPQRYGQNYQADGYLGFAGHDFGAPAEQEAQLTKIAADPQVAGINADRIAPVSIGAGSADVWELKPYGGGITPVSVKGHEPRSDDEITFAPATADALHIKVGQELQVKGEKPLTLRVVGITLVPTGPHSTYAEGAWVRSGTMDALYPSGYFKFHLYLVRFQPGVVPSAGIAALKAAYGVDLEAPVRPTAVNNLRTVRGLPVLLGVFLALLAVGAVGHALATAVRRRRHDMAVLRALGLTRPQVRATIAWQATTLALVGLAFGIPLGVALARSVWRVVADQTPVQYVPPLAVLALLVIGPAAVVVVNVLAAYPGQRSVRQRIGTVLRAE